MTHLFAAALTGLLCAAPLMGQGNQPAPKLRVTSRAVLVDIIVTDGSGKPVTGLARDAFTVKEQGKPQTISFFEEHGAASAVGNAESAEMPKLPPDTFTNFSPFPQPPAVNVILLDSLNTRMESQSDVHRHALKFLQSAKPGTRSAIFTMGLDLRFIQGFNDDPAVLAAALSSKKNLDVEPAAMLKSQAEKDATAILLELAGSSLAAFMHENDVERTIDRELRTLANLQRLATFLKGFPGRKNIIWFVEKVPGGFVIENGDLISNPAVDDEIRKTLAMLGDARAALYPVDARGVAVNAQYTAENNPKAPSGDGGAIREEDKERNSDQLDEQIVAEQSGGRAFVNTNDLGGVIDKVTSNSSHFYTLSYVPKNAKMDGGWRKIGVKVAGDNYSLSYRRGYFAVDTAQPDRVRKAEKQAVAARSPEGIDPLQPFMELGMPQSQQILYKVRVEPTSAPANEAPDKKIREHYKVDFAIDLNDLDLTLDTDGLHKGTLSFSVMVFDRYGNTVTREDHLVGLEIKPDAYAVFQSTGVQLHAALALPKGNYWVRTGVYDPRSRKVGTLEVPLSAVVPLQSAAK